MSQLLMPEEFISAGQQVSLQIEVEIQKFSLPDAAIAQLKEKYSKLEIIDRNDRAGYDMVKVAISDVRSRRTGIEAKRKELKSDYIAIGKAIDREAERLTNLIQPLEDYLKGKKEIIDNEIAEEKRKEEEARLIKKNNRIAQLQKFRMTFYDGKFRLADIALDPSQVEFAADEIFNNVLENIEKEYQKLIAAEKQEEEKRIADQQELERLRKQEEEANRIIWAEKDRLDQELRDKERIEREAKELKQQQHTAEMKQKTDQRCDQLFKLGLTFNFQHESYVFQDVNVHTTEINPYMVSDEDWNRLVEKIAPVIEQRKKEVEEKRLAEIEREKKAAVTLALRTKEIKDQQDKEAEAEKLAMGDDKGRFRYLNSKLELIIIPEMKSNKGKRVAKEVEAMIENAKNHIGKEIFKTKVG